MIRSLRDVALAPLRGERYVREVAAAPEAVEARLRERLGRPPKRMLGVLKVSDEWVGVAAGKEFVVWERRAHATRVRGRIVGRRGGSRVEATIALTRGTYVLTVVLFTLFAIASFGLLAREEGLGLTPAGIAVALAGGLATLAVFWTASIRQAAALRRFLDDVLSAWEPVRGDARAPRG